jgi:predicted ATP-grasp superfamily ATP-dependent carboligase
LTAAGTRRRSRLGLTSDDRPPAIVVGLDCITGLQTARLLAARGVPVIGLVADRNHFCARTRVPRAVVRSRLNGDGLIDDLEAIRDQLPGEAVLVPCTDAAVLAIASAAARLDGGPFRFVLPDAEVVGRLMDKVPFAEHALATGLPIPPTRILRTRDDAEAAGGDLPMPAVVKPGLKTPSWQSATKAKAIRVETAAELVATWDRASAWATPLIAQAWIAGPENGLVSVNTYHDRQGNRRVAFVARKLRQWPVDTGTSSLGEEVRDDEALAIADRLFGSVAYRGLGYVEMKRDLDGRHWIVEPNIGRPTGRSAIAENGGVELVLSAYLDALGEPLPDAIEQRYRGVKWIYWRHDLQSAIVHARRGDLTVQGWWRSIRGRRIEAVGSWRDPMPFVADLVGAARAAVRVAGRSIVRSVRGRRAATAP